VSEKLSTLFARFAGPSDNRRRAGGLSTLFARFLGSGQLGVRLVREGAFNSLREIQSLNTG